MPVSAANIQTRRNGTLQKYNNTPHKVVLCYIELKAATLDLVLLLHDFSAYLKSISEPESYFFALTPLSSRSFSSAIISTSSNRPVNGFNYKKEKERGGKNGEK
jgi:hypothetical protein